MMIRVLMLAVLSLCGCGLRLSRGVSGWELESKKFALVPIKDGRIMPDGWLLQNYSKRGKGDYQQKQRADVDLTFSRSEDDGFLAVDEIELEQAKSLRTVAERFMAQLSQQQLEVNVGRYYAYVDIDEPVTEVASAQLGGDGIEGYEVVMAQRHQGQATAFRHVYLALIREPKSRRVVTVSYVNSPASFVSGIDDARQLARRVKLGAVTLPADAAPLDGEKAAPGGGTIRL